MELQVTGDGFSVIKRGRLKHKPSYRQGFHSGLQEKTSGR